MGCPAAICPASGISTAPAGRSSSARTRDLRLFQSRTSTPFSSSSVMCFWSSERGITELLADFALGGREAPFLPVGADEIEDFFLLRSKGQCHIKLGILGDLPYFLRRILIFLE